MRNQFEFNHIINNIIPKKDIDIKTQTVKVKGDFYKYEVNSQVDAKHNLYKIVAVNHLNQLALEPIE
ncbi:hypothetical protein R4B61_01070 [Fructilactobacillus vespulae]|uniref:hypothetical protein n=1 Tax=Fructilactobacillus vespulae TaxID=1249630 RepID=UPI0039B51950